MKTKELIRQLQEADPTGEVEVTAAGADIYYAASAPAYWDGPHFILQHDPAKVGRCYSIIGGRINYEGMKVKLHLVAWDDVLLDHPDAPIEVSEHRKAQWVDDIEKQRVWVKNLQAEIEEDEKIRVAGGKPPRRAIAYEDGEGWGETLQANFRLADEPEWNMLEPGDRVRWKKLGTIVEEALAPKPAGESG
jgi:hypothetical protein